MMLNTEIKRPVLRYHGGKFRLAKWIVSHFPEHRIYTEVFGGAASCLMRKERSYSEVYNDQWDTVVNVFRVLRDSESAKELEMRLVLTPYSRTEFSNTGEIHISKVEDEIERARLTILRSFAGFGSAATNAKYATGFRSNSNRSGTTPAHDWMNYPNHIKTFVDRLRGVVIENRDYRDVLKIHDTPKTLHYVDPPYVHSTRNMDRGNAAYEFEMNDNDHAEMSDILNSLSGMVIVSGYDCDLYRDLFKDWKQVTKATYADGAVPRTESLWLNKAAQ